MSNSNKKTLETYGNNFQKYIDGTVQVTRDDHFQGQWITSVLDRVQKDARILEIGSAFGRDVRFMVEKGFTNLELTDAFDEAVDYLNQNGLLAKKLNVLTDDLGGTYDVIFASAVFLHFTANELQEVLGRLRGHITSRGYLAFSVKQGEGDEWSDHKMGSPRYFRYWQAEDMMSLLKGLNYSVVDVRETSDKKWLHITAQIVR